MGYEFQRPVRRLILFNVALVLLACAEPPQPVAQMITPSSNGQRSTEEVQTIARWKLPKALREVSGLAANGRGGVYAVADEEAAIYLIDPASGKVKSVYALGNPILKGDFEGIALNDGWLYLVTSKGVLIRTHGAADGEIAAYEAFTVPVDCEIEGLASDPVHPVLWLVCKSFEDASLSERIVRLHAWSVIDQQLLPKQQLNLDLLKVLEQTGQRRFKPSGLAFQQDAEGTALVVISGAQRAYARWRWNAANSQFINAARLPVGHKQAEGIATAPDGGWLIADEGGKKRGRLRWYAPGEIF